MYRIFGLLLVSLLWLSSCSQKVDIEPQSTIRWHLQSEFKEVIKAVKLSDGGLAIIGASERAPAILVLEKDMSVRFYTTFDNYRRGRLNDLIELKDGSFMAVGYSLNDENGNILLNSTGLILKISANGNLIDSRIWDDSEYYEYLADLVLTKDGKVYVIGGDWEAFRGFEINTNMTLSEQFSFPGLYRYVIDAAERSDGKIWICAMKYAIAPSGNYYLNIFNWDLFLWDPDTDQISRSYESSSVGHVVGVPWYNDRAQILPRIGAFLSEDGNGYIYSTGLSASVQTYPKQLLIQELSPAGAPVFTHEILVGTNYVHGGTVACGDDIYHLGSKGEGSGSLKYSVVKTNRQGEEIWQREFGRDGVVQLFLSVDCSGEFIEVLGSEYDEGKNVSFIRIKLNSDGDFIE